MKSPRAYHAWEKQGSEQCVCYNSDEGDEVGGYMYAHAHISAWGQRLLLKGYARNWWQ